MTPSEIGAIMIGLFAGYWVVSKLLFRAPKAVRAPNPGAPPNTTQSWSDILQVEPSATAIEIRNAYKHMISKYHPDKVDTLGQELKDFAGHKTQEITAAYRAGMRACGADP